MANERKYEATHPWISFTCDTRSFDYKIWMGFGEAGSKCEHMAGVPLQPYVEEELQKMYLVKGVLASTAIEGNTLSEEQARKYLEGQLELPFSQQYLGNEIENLQGAVDLVIERAMIKDSPEITVEAIKEYNRIILDGLELEPDVEPGEIRGHSVVAGRYRGAPAEDCGHLLQRMCDWLNSPEFLPTAGGDNVTYGLLRAMLAHLYLAWIHPFGDGNGRTARLVEFQILIAAGLPLPATHLLSNHYNLTREEYYRQLDRASRSGGDIDGFVAYALQGFVDGLREQLAMIRAQQWSITWRDYVYSLFRDKENAVGQRRRQLALDLSEAVDPVPIHRVADISPRIAKAYANKTQRTLSRDLKELEDMNLVEITKEGARVRREIILAFLPNRRVSSEEIEALDIFLPEEE